MTPDFLVTRHTLATAVARYDELRARDVLASGPADPGSGPARDLPPGPLTSQQALELLALGEFISRTAAAGCQLTVRSAREAGASWSQIGAALGIAKQSAWEAHNRWIDQQVSQAGYRGLDEPDDGAARGADAEPGDE